MNLTRTLLTAAVALAAVGGASLSTTTDAAAKGGKGFGKSGGYGHFHRFHGHRFHGHRWHRHYHFRRHFHVNYNPCWKWTRYGLVNVCKVRVIAY